MLGVVGMFSASGVGGGAAVWWCLLRLVVVSCWGVEGAGDAFDADSGGVLEVAGYGRGGHDRGRVDPRWRLGCGGRRGGLAGRACSSAKDCSGVPQFVVGGDGLTGIHRTGWDER